MLVKTSIHTSLEGNSDTLVLSSLLLCRVHKLQHNIRNLYHIIQGYFKTGTGRATTELCLTLMRLISS